MLDVDDEDFYEWETHIFFDDAMEPTDDGKEFQVNSFVRLLVEQVDIQVKYLFKILFYYTLVIYFLLSLRNTILSYLKRLIDICTCM